MLKILTTDFEFQDERGSLTQLVHSGYKQVNVIFSKKGAFRGGHYHKLNEETFYVVSGLLEITVDGQNYTFRKGGFFGIEPFDLHSFRFLEDTVLVSMYSQGVELENGTKDIYTGDDGIEKAVPK